MVNDSMALPPPPEVIKMREIEERFGQVVDWAHEAAIAASQVRLMGGHRSMLIHDLDKRWKERLRIQNVYFQRLCEIEETEEAFKAAYYSARLTLNFDEILGYSSLMRPIVGAARAIEAKQRMELMMARANEKTEQAEARAQRKKQRKKVLGQES